MASMALCKKKFIYFHDFGIHFVGSLIDCLIQKNRFRIPTPTASMAAIPSPSAKLKSPSKQLDTICVTSFKEGIILGAIFQCSNNESYRLRESLSIKLQHIISKTYKRKKHSLHYHSTLDSIISFGQRHR